MAGLEHEIIQLIQAAIDSEGAHYPAWYVGITDNPERRLYEQHRVDRQDRRTVCVNAGSFMRAREIEEYFLKLGTAGGGGGGTTESTFVYAYYRTERTEP